MTLALTAKRIARSEPAFEAVPLIAKQVENYHWGPATGIEAAQRAPTAFKSSFRVEQH
jgi:hypothetical protein